MIELGVLPEVNQATTAMFVFLSSSLATIQFVVLGRTMPMYVAWFMSWVVVATFVGQTAIDFLLKWSGRSSPITLSIAAIIGTIDIFQDFMEGAYMGFSPHSLCML